MSGWCVHSPAHAVCTCVSIYLFLFPSESSSTTAHIQNRGYASHYFLVVFNFNVKWEDINEVVCQP